jgi:hypothetical protein
MNRGLSSIIALLLAALGPAAATAQESNFVPTASPNVQAPAGWLFTPALSYAGAWDDNVLIRGAGDAAVSDFQNVVSPRATVDFNGKRGQLAATYDGGFVLYRNLGALDSYDQRATLFGRRLLTPHLSLIVRNSAAFAPTTELVALAGVPFVRTGSRLDDFKGGIEASLSKYTSLVATYDFQWVDFDRGVPGAEDLRGGHSSGGTLVLRRAISPRTTMTAEYNLQHGLVRSAGTPGNGPEMFDIQNVWGGGDYKLSAFSHLFASVGLSRLGATELADARIAPAFRLGAVAALRDAVLDLLYSREFTASYGIGGTTENNEVSARFRMPLARRVYATSSVAWRSNEPIIVENLPLRSMWIEATVGYAATPWVRLEAFYGRTHQTIDRPGGELNRNRIGFQITTAKPVRVR